jgi:hypothetical protein
MDQEDKELLRRILDISQKNNRILESIKQSMFWSRVFRYIYWAIIIGTAIGAYYFLEPYIEEVLQIYGGVKGGINNFFQ